AIRPDGVFKMGETVEALTSNEVLSFNLSPGIPGVDAGVALSGEHSRSKEKKYYTTIIGVNQPDPDFGYHTEARFRLEENPSQKTGVPSHATLAVLLEREDDEDFIMTPYIEVMPNFGLSTLISSLASSRSSDDPIMFSVKETLSETPFRATDAQCFGDIDDDFDAHATGIEAHQDEVDRWYQLPMEDKWEDVMGLLQNREVPCRWDTHCGDSSVANFLEGYKKEGLKIKDDRDVRSPTVLHMLARNFDKNGFARLDEQSKQRIINFLLDHRETEYESQASLKIKNLEDPILIVALRWDNKDFIQFLLSHCPDSVKDLLHASDEERTNTLHHIFREHFLKAIRDYSNKTTPKKRLDLRNTYKLAMAFAKIASAKTIAAQDKHGNTPLHYALDYRLCHIPTDTHQKLVFQMLEAADDFLRENSHKGNQFNYMEDPESPYLYFLRTQREFLMTLPNKASSVVAARKPTVQEGMPSKLNSKTYVSKDGVPLPVAKADEPSRGGLEASKEMRLRGAIARDYVEKGKTTPFASDEQARSGHEKQPPKDMLPEAKDSSLLGTRSVHALVRRPTFRTQSPVSFAAKDSESEGQSSTVDIVSAVQMPPPPSQPNDMSKQQAKALHVAGTKSIQKTALSSQDYKHAAEQIRHRLKLHYIRTRPDIDAKDLLYGKVASDKNLYFDATHLEGGNPAAMVGLINMLSQPGGFEDTLSYVYLPCLSSDGSKLTNYGSASRPHVANQGRQRLSKPDNDHSTGRDSLIAVFDALATAGVRNILHLQVDDMYDNRLYHTDAAIERSIRGVDSFFTEAKRAEGGIDVEIWDWIKPDLSIDVIRFAAPNAVKLNLYWSGNQTVLRGWARKKGIPSLYLDNGKKLRTLVLHASPVSSLSARFQGAASALLPPNWFEQSYNGVIQGIESAKRMGKALDQFKNEIDNRTAGGVEVVIRDWAGNRAAGPRADGQLRESTPGQSQSPPDHDWVKSMESFRRSLLSVHGNMPQEIRPQRIKVALIDDGVHLTSLNTYNESVQVTGLSYWTPTFTAEGTFIGQSWHQSTRGHGTTMANMLVRVNPWVILYVIRIQDLDDNSLNGDGTVKMHAESAAKAIRAAIIRDVDIITMSWTVRNVLDGDTSTKAPNSGSSVSTALAAGLASLVMYLPRLLQAYHEHAVGKDSDAALKYATYAGKLRMRENMRRAFENITDQSHEDKKFLPLPVAAMTDNQNTSTREE
ncbi:hypothetical protein INS49_015368, partial [Diaporthe citri]|uniref:uncharacterized protein n=1 Tax=Diaporthe citri TaxID=83186 RepID=UPI001C801EE2